MNSKRYERGASAKVKHPNNSPPIKARILRLTRDYGVLEKAFNENTDLFSRSFCYADAMLWVLRTALNDMINVRVRTIERGGEKQVDLQSYLKMYEEHLKRQQKDEHFLPPPEEDQPTVFGGTS